MLINGLVPSFVPGIQAARNLANILDKLSCGHPQLSGGFSSSPLYNLCILRPVLNSHSVYLKKRRGAH